MKISDTLLGLFFVVLSAIILIVSSEFPTLKNQSIGAGTFPSLIAIIMGASGVLLAISGLRSFNLQNAVTLAPWLKKKNVWYRVATVPVFVIAYILLSKPVGFPIVVPIILSVFLFITTSKPLRSVAIGCFASFAIWMLFAEVLRVPLPLGLLTEVIY